MNGRLPWLGRAGAVGFALAAAALASAALAPFGWSAPASEQVVPRIDRKPGPAETLSSSSQFLAHGPVQADRALLVTRAEEVREEVTRLLDRQERRGTATGFPSTQDQDQDQPLVIHLWLRGEANPPVQPRLYQVDGVSQPVLGIVIARAGLAASDDFRREVVRLLLVERVFRSQPSAAVAGRGEVMPAWLESGVMEALDHVRAGRPSDRFASLFAQGLVLSVEDILTARPAELEAGARDIFAASAGCLVMALLEQPEGPERFRRFLEAMPSREGSWQNLLVRQFPGLALSRNSLEKWWALQAAALATPDLLEPMTALQTDQLLAEALVVRARHEAPGLSSASPVVRWIKRLLPGRPDPATPPAAPAAPAASAATEVEVFALTEFERIAALPKRSDVLRANQAALATLMLRAFPLHRPIIDDYQRVIGRLSQGKSEGLAARCEELAVRRREVLAAAEATSDLLNWYEATQRASPSGSFDRYFQQLESPVPAARSSVEDPIARSLDELEDEFMPLRD